MSINSSQGQRSKHIVDKKLGKGKPDGLSSDLKYGIFKHKAEKTRIPCSQSREIQDVKKMKSSSQCFEPRIARIESRKEVSRSYMKETASTKIAVERSHSKSQTREVNAQNWMCSLRSSGVRAESSASRDKKLRNLKSNTFAPKLHPELGSRLNSDIMNSKIIEERPVRTERATLGAIGSTTEKMNDIQVQSPSNHTRAPAQQNLDPGSPSDTMHFPVFISNSKSRIESVDRPDNSMKECPQSRVRVVLSSTLERVSERPSESEQFIPVEQKDIEMIKRMTNFSDQHPNFKLEYHAKSSLSKNSKRTQELSQKEQKIVTPEVRSQRLHTGAKEGAEGSTLKTPTKNIGSSSLYLQSLSEVPRERHLRDIPSK